MTQDTELPVKVTYNPHAIEVARVDALAELTAAKGQTIESADDAKAWGEIARMVARRKAEVDAMRDSVIKPLNAA